MKYKVRIGFEHEILVADRLLNMKYKLHIGFDHEIQGTDRL